MHSNKIDVAAIWKQGADSSSDTLLGGVVS